MSETNPLVSVIIPTYNRKDVLLRALKSVQNQTYKNIEIIIVDDGSDDGTDLILKEIPGVKTYFSSENRGVSISRNFGIKKASGEYVAFLDSDDEWLEDKVKRQVDCFLRNKETVCVHTEELWIRDGVRVNQMKKHKKGGGDQFIPSLSLCLISPSSVMLKRNLFEKIGLFREDFPVCEDYDLWLKLTSLYQVEFIDNPLIKKYGGHEDQLSRKYFAMDYYLVKSIDWILKNRNLNEDHRAQAIKVLLKKCRILLKGYEKHKNLENFDEIKSIQDSYFS